MCTKKIIGLLILAIPVSGIAQQIPLPVTAKPNAVTSVTVAPQPSTGAKTTAISPGILTIQALSALQEQEMASAVSKQLSIATLNNDAAAPVTLIRVKPVKPKHFAPNLESVVGPEGQEVASFRLDSGTRTAVKVGESIGSWHINQISNGRVRFEANATAGRKHKVRVMPLTPRAQWISVGEFLK